MGMAYHKGPCLPKVWWGDLSVMSVSGQFVVPELLDREAQARAAGTRIERLQDMQRDGYASGLTMAAILREERNVHDANLLVMHTLLRRHVNKAPVDSDAQVTRALAALQSYIVGMSAFLIERGSDMKGLRKSFKHAPRRFVDAVRLLKDALPP